MNTAWWAVLGGVFGAGLTAGILLLRKGRELDERGAQLQLALRTQGADLEAYMLQQGDSLQIELQKMAKMRAAEITPGIVQDLVAGTYSITPARIAQVRALADRWD